MNAIQLKNLQKKYYQYTALKDVSMEVQEGSIHALLGPNGAGKTTTLKILAGILNRSAGSVYLWGEELKEMRHWYNWKLKIGLLLDRPPLYDDMTVAGYLDFAAKIKNLNRVEAKMQVEKILHRANLFSERDRGVEQLSHGQRQRLGIAQAILGKNQLVILDEPTLGLDPVSIKEIRQLILSLRGERTVILSTHHLHEAEMMADGITILNKGEVLLSGELKVVQEKFKVPNLVELHIRHWSDEHFEQMNRIKSIQNISFTPPKGVSAVYDEHAEKRVWVWCHKKDNEDFRYHLLKELIQLKIEVVHLNQVNADLEEIFLQTLYLSRGKS